MTERSANRYCRPQSSAAGMTKKRKKVTMSNTEDKQDDVSPLKMKWEKGEG